MLACLLTVGVGTASAARTHQFQKAFGAGELSQPGPIAVDQTGGDVYVLDYGTQTIHKFDAEGQPADFSALGTNVLDGSGTAAGYFGFRVPAGAQVAVDASGGPTDGTIYVANSFAGVVEIFSATGAHLGQLAPVADEPCGVAVGPSGVLYVGEGFKAIDRYEPQSGVVTADDLDGRITDTPSGASCGLAADSAGSVYARANAGFGGFFTLTKYLASDFGTSSPPRTPFPLDVGAVAVDPATDDVYADAGTYVRQYSQGGDAIGTFTSPGLTGSMGVAVHGATGRVYVANTNGSPASVQLYGPTVTVPDAATAAATDTTPTTATIRGTVAPNGTPTTYRFEYGTTTAYGTSVPSTPADAGSGDGVVPVTADLAGLRADTTYHYRVVATNANGTVTSADATFRTTGPVLSIGPPTAVTPGSATFHGTVDMRGLPGGTFHFAVEGVDSSFGRSTASVAVPAGAGIVPVSAALDGLPAGSALTVRLIADSPASHSYTDLVEFRTVTAPTFVPPPVPPVALDPYGCARPTLAPVARAVRPGEDVRITGSDLGVGATVQLAGRVTGSTGYTADGFAVRVPDDARGVLALTVNCGAQSNTIGLTVATPPSTRFSAAASAAGRRVRVVVRVPGAGAVRVDGADVRRVRARATTSRSLTLRTSLTARAARALRAAPSGRLRVGVDVSFAPAGGDERTVTRRVTVRRAAR